jgi:hypothetical protein
MGNESTSLGAAGNLIGTLVHHGQGERRSKEPTAVIPCRPTTGENNAAKAAAFKTAQAADNTRL